MWPFQNASRGLSHRRVDDDFAVTGQIEATDIPAIAAAGFRSIVCARPDNEEMGQPAFAAIAAAAEAAGLRAVYIPVSGMIGEGHLIRMESALNDLPRPMLGYCRSGARATALYTTAKRLTA